MKKHDFVKISGSGNDFIMIDDRDNHFRLSPNKISRICKRKTGIGADGLILLKKDKKYDFKMKYYNSDGYEAEMCGNGARSIVFFAKMKGIVKGGKAVFSSKKGAHEAFIKGNIVKVRMGEISIPVKMKIKTKLNVYEGYFMNTGVPHFVLFSKNIEKEDVFNKGRDIRYSNVFKKHGTNVDFIKKEENRIILRTYERGVEDETLACGTGAVACAVISSLIYGLDSPLTVRVKSGENLKIHFDKIFDDVYLEGKVELVYEGSFVV